MKKKFIRIIHKSSGEVLVDGPVGWGITPFEGNYYVRKKYLISTGFKSNNHPGLCVYKFIYVWLDLKLNNGELIKDLAWLYWLPNPLFPFIWYRVAIAGQDSQLLVEHYE